MKVLVAEDELYAREALVRQIQRYDTEHIFEVVEAANGEDGLVLFQEHHPELVLTDIRMPRMDGLQLLERIREQSPKTKVVILSAYSDFEYARSALTYGASDYLLKPIDDVMLAKCLDKLVLQHRSERKEILLSGKDMATQYVLNSIQKPNYHAFVERSMFGRVFPSYRIGVIYFKGSRPEPEHFLADMEQVCGSTFWTQLRFLALESDLWVLVLVPGEMDLFLWRRIRRILEEQGFSSGIGVSSIYTKTDCVTEAYQEARAALRCKIYVEENLLFAERIRQEAYTDYYLPKKWTEKLEEALEDGSERRVRGAVQGIFEEIRSAGRVKPECLELLYSQMGLLYRRAIGAGDSQKEISRMSAGILKFDSLEEMQDYVERIAESICRMKRSGQTSQCEGTGMGSEIVGKIQEYVRQHYNTEITVRDLAEKELFMNQNYVSHLFVEKTGISFSTFLRQVRVAHAKELLQEKRWSVTEVASMVGYNDTSQFIRIFKQETGMTPKKYCSAGGETI